MRIRSLRASALAAIVCLSALRAHATTIIVPDDSQLVSKTPLVVIATVQNSRSVMRNGGIWTESVLHVDQVLKGNLSDDSVVVRELGGEVDGHLSVIYGSPLYMAQERVLAFLIPTPRGDYQTMDLFVGKFSQRVTTDGERVWYRPDSSVGTRLLDHKLVPLVATDVARRADGFERFIRSAGAGAIPSSGYLIENPRFQSRFSPQFTLIDEPSIYRWFAFDNGTPVPWRSVGRQNGFSGGGSNELQTAMAAWSGFSGANVRYTYTTSWAGSGAGVNTPNGVNEVLFEDPYHEIAGSWDPSKGGTVGLGGFNAVAGTPLSWTGPFDADSTHRAQSYSAVNILEGNLVVQDGVSPQQNVSSSILAEILAHEFGHTLGLGHSADSSALMYFQVTGLGPTLRGDDQSAVRWLYPSGSTGGGTVTIPAAPSGLTAVVSGATATLSWTDNADNETGEIVYQATRTGAFTRVAQLAAGSNRFTVGSLVKGESYSFRVTASSSVGESAPSNVVTVTIQSDTPQAAFTVSPFTGTANVTTFTFTDQSTGPVNSWNWNFGDGSSSTAKAAIHRYRDAGNYSATLIVGGAAGTSSTSRTIVVTSGSSPLQSAFSFTPAAPTIIDNVALEDQTTGPVTSWNWNFGDGTTSTQQNPTHRFATTGSFTVTLVAGSSSLNSSSSRLIAVGSGSGGTANVQADFALQPSEPSAGSAVQLNDTSTGSPQSWYWDFGDGFSSTVKNPLHTFERAGEFIVSLTAGNSTSSSSRTRRITVEGAAQTARTLIPVAGATAGASGSNWRSEVTLFNAGPAVKGIATWLPSTGLQKTSTFALAAGASTSYANALSELFDLSEGSGAILFAFSSTTGTPDVRVASRTYTGSNGGTYGQYVNDDPGLQQASTTYLTALQASRDFRTNIGLVNISSGPETIDLTLRLADGSALASTTRTLPSGSFSQSALASLFPQLSDRSDLTLVITATEANSVFAYASVVDNRTQDPIFIAASTPLSANSAVIPAVGHAAGAGGTFWRSDLTLFNPSAVNIQLSLTFLPSGSDNRAASAARTVTLAPLTTTTLSDVTSTLGATDFNGALELSWSGATGPVSISRTFTDRPSDHGTFGQSIEATQRFASRSIVPGLSSNASYRSNLGIVNAGSTTADLTLTLLDASGSIVATTNSSLAARSQMQRAVGQLFSGIDAGTLGIFTLSVSTTGAPVFAYGSVVDNVSGDPIFIPGR